MRRGIEAHLPLHFFHNPPSTPLFECAPPLLCHGQGRWRKREREMKIKRSPNNNTTSPSYLTDFSHISSKKKNQQKKTQKSNALICPILYSKISLPSSIRFLYTHFLFSLRQLAVMCQSGSVGDIVVREGKRFSSREP